MSRKLLMNNELEPTYDPSYDPYNIDGMKVMTYGKGVNWGTHKVIDNAQCWATVDAVTVVSGQGYRITCNASWSWVFSYDDNDNFVSELVRGGSGNPQDYAFTADTNHIRFGVYDPDHKLTYCTVKAV